MLNKKFWAILRLILFPVFMLIGLVAILLTMTILLLALLASSISEARKPFTRQRHDA
jgi:hypothetical protein